MMVFTVLVVEDDEILRSLTAEVVSLLNFDVIACATADEALPILKTSSSIALVITDVCMPGNLDGLELAHLIWANWSDIPVIVTSGNRSVPIGELPAHAIFLRKPWLMETMHQSIKALIKA